MPNEKRQLLNERLVVVFSLDNEEFGVDINKVVEIIRMEQITRVANTEKFIKGVINLRGSILVVIDLATKLGLQKKEYNENTRIIVVEADNSIIGIIVNSATEIIGLENNQIKEPPSIITKKINSDYINGVGIIKNRLLVLLEMEKVLKIKTKEFINKKTAEIEDTEKKKEEEDEKITEKNEEEQKISEIRSKIKDSQKKIASEEKEIENVSEEFHFITHEKKPLKNVHELMNYIHALKEEEFKNFVNEEKNDFYNWVKCAVKDNNLAESIKNSKSKDDITKEIMNAISGIKGLG